ncbi:MAG: hypothetical protein OXB94_11940 [Nitrospira sp.]|nr:hypothetical protein [Nitrospira sp.]
MARINVMIPEDILQDVDHAATEEKLTRSALLQKAARRYLEAKRLEQEALERKHRMQKAAAKMDKLANKFGKWDGVGTIRQFRDRRTGVTR